MRLEIEEIPSAAQRLLDQGRAEFTAGAEALIAADPDFVVTVARGSSDHAASFLKYAIELTAGRAVASLGPSIVSIYGRTLRLGHGAALAISQSGKSPDIVATTAAARASGAVTFALTNTAGSPLADAATRFIDLRAGPEKSVAATKSFVNSVLAGLALIAHWTGDADLLKALDEAPAVLARALQCDWTPLADVLVEGSSLYVLGRGPALAIASEAALKFKETCGLHAEAYSAAEVLHGPARIVERGFPVLVLAAPDASSASVAEVAERLAGQGARVFLAGATAPGATALPVATTAHPLLATLALIVSFYAMVESLSRRRGFDPDRPPYLKKVTETR
jgi:glucosamine--fructose-6-phosphate aminotransferase (isomerizing)